MSADAVVVTDNPAASRFEARLDAERAGVAEYELTEKYLVFTHTLVEKAYEGRGVGSALIRSALDQVRADGERLAVPVCPFVRTWIERHPSYADVAHLGPWER
ncbi:MAG: GNAT family N-acetyltransferase [Propioniciclava sp.]